jgi:squalene-hopene/tetraprenyl-beta-curcumene cyclase
MLTRLCRIAAACAGLCLATLAAEDLKPQVEALIGRSQAWLLAQQQDNGAFVAGAKFSIGITAMAVDCLATPPLALAKDDPRLVKAVAFLLKNQQADGGFYAVDEGLGNYGTALSLMALSQAGGASPEQIRKAQDYLFGLQNHDEGSIADGGIGYGSKGAGHEDLSNTAMAVEGLRRSGVPASDPHLQKALAFMERCQDLSPSNKLPWVKNTGGAVYSPEESKAGGSWAPEAKAGEPVPELLPYGSMTYQLISSYVALDLHAGDPRLDAALDWVKKHYQFDANPGLPKDGKGKERQGLFYYYMAMAKTFDLLDQGTLKLPDGREVDWRADLFKAIKDSATEAALPDGTKVVVWMNGADRWAEGIPHVTTGYLLKALKRIHQSL